MNAEAWRVAPQWVEVETRHAQVARHGRRMQCIKAPHCSIHQVGANVPGATTLEELGQSLVPEVPDHGGRVGSSGSCVKRGLTLAWVGGARVHAE